MNNLVTKVRLYFHISTFFGDLLKELVLNETFLWKKGDYLSGKYLLCIVFNRNTHAYFYKELDFAYCYVGRSIGLFHVCHHSFLRAGQALCESIGDSAHAFTYFCAAVIDILQSQSA